MLEHSAFEQARRGIALVIVLAMIVLITVLVVGFTVNMRTERQASNAIFRSQSAAVAAQGALAHAVSLLNKYIPQPVPPGGVIVDPTNWIVSPGMLTLVQGNSDATTVPTITRIPLSSNPTPAPGASDYTSTATDANLNPPLVTRAGNSILPGSQEMRVAWVPLLRDPSQTATASNQIVGRYAFWIDDESAKININTAAGKPKQADMDFSKVTPGVVTIGGNGGGTYPLGHPGSVNLDLLGSLDLPGLANGVLTSGGFTNPEAIKQYVTAGDTGAFYDSNKFNLTAWSNDPEFNVFGKPRLYQTRKMLGQLGVNMPSSQFYRDIDAPIYFPTDENKNGGDILSLYYTAKGISSLLNSRNWPGMPNKSFVDKWDKDASSNSIPHELPPLSVGFREADQFAWNLVTLGHFADNSFSSAPTARWMDYVDVQPRTTSGPEWVGTANQPNASAQLGSLSGKAILPLYPAPLVDEVCLVITPVALPTLGKYDLQVSLQTELWLPPGYSACALAPAHPMTIGLTHLEYTVKQGAITATQADTKYRGDGSGEMNGIKVLAANLGSDFGTINPGDYVVVTPTGTGSTFHIRNGSGFGNQTGPGFYTTGGPITINFKMRLYSGTVTDTTNFAATQMIPVWDTHVPVVRVGSSQLWGGPTTPLNAVSAFTPPPDDNNGVDYIEFNFTVDGSQLSAGNPIKRSLEIADPRLGGLAKMWQLTPPSSSSTTLDIETIGAVNEATTAAVTAGWNLNKFAYLDFTAPATITSSRPPSTGLISLLPTGMQRGIPGATLKLQPSPDKKNLPDWLLLDLLAQNASVTNLSNASSMSLMNRTSGKLNVNAAVYPNTGKFVIPQRWQPLQALFQNMPNATSTTGDAPSSVVTNIINHSVSGQDFGVLGKAGVYDYPGEICEIAGVADTGTTDWDKEVLIRNLASSITQHSNVFSVWGVGQTIRKNPANNVVANQGIFETRAGGAAADDSIVGERRFEAVVERYVWQGNDSTAGNGHVPASGSTYDRLSSSRSVPGISPPSYAEGSWEQLDGPSAPTYPPSGVNPGPWTKNAAAAWTSSTAENATNPVSPTMKYRVVSFRYLDN